MMVVWDTCRRNLKLSANCKPNQQEGQYNARKGGCHLGPLFRKAAKSLVWTLGLYSKTREVCYGFLGIPKSYISLTYLASSNLLRMKYA